MIRSATIRLAAALMAAAILPAHAGSGKKTGAGVNIYSPEREAALGRQLAHEVERQAKLLDDPITNEFVNRLGQTLARNSDPAHSFTFRVIEDDSVNAFALPGGYVFINTGLLQVSEDENELAAVLAHEIAHVAARHMTRQATREQLSRLISSPLSSISAGLIGVAARQAAAVALPLSFAHFDRASEFEADSLGVRYLLAAGYDAGGMISVFEKMQALERRKPGSINGLFSTHPPDAERIRRAQMEISQAPQGREEFVITSSEYAGMRERLIGLRIARPESGAVSKSR